MIQSNGSQRAFVFGASGDIGQAICQQLAATGWSLVLHGFHHAEILETACQQLSQAYPQQDFQYFTADLMAADFLKPGLLNQFGDYQALIFAQGTTDYQLFSTTTTVQQQQLFQLHLFSPMALIRAAESHLLAQDHGRIVFIGSIYGAVGSAMEVLYSAVKGAQSSFANAYAREVAGSGLTVNVVAPGAVATQMNADFSENELADLKAEIPLGRLAQPQEIATWVKHLLATDADYLTGQTLYIDGGWLK
ncbi:elongation factor P 5-aminopentanone reductase [Lapidilactobacillus wuchangensis]|uniref:elongation factor P 5-aminopentanone reductase n=1 Tax=Lapidilactobacillus wuchangensis TaxID=2486001 RepID=UPI000F77999B|nr:SDR family oxidoreductase [Lapidilactobacillus wuchangensis]